MKRNISASLVLVFVIILATSSAQAQMTERTAPAVIDECTRPNMYTVPATWSPQIGMSRADWVLARNRTPCSPRVGRSVVLGRPIYHGGYYPGAMDTYAEWLKWDPYLRQFFSQERNRQMYGLFKIDGPDRQHRNVRVLVNDRDKGVASKFDQKVNGAIIVQVRDEPCDPFAGKSCEVRELKIQFVKESKNGIQRISRFAEIEPFEVTGFRNMARFRVDNDLFEHAEIADPLQQQLLPDELEGGTVPSKKKIK